MGANVLRIKCCNEDDIGGSGWYVDITDGHHTVMLAQGRTPREAYRRAARKLKRLVAKCEEGK